MVTRTNFWDAAYVADRSGPERNLDACYSHIEEGPSFEELVEATRRGKTVTFRLVDFKGGYDLLPRDYKVRPIKIIIDHCDEYLIEGILYLREEGECGYNFEARYHPSIRQAASALWAIRGRRFHWLHGFKPDALKSAS